MDDSWCRWPYRPASRTVHLLANDGVEGSVFEIKHHQLVELLAMLDVRIREVWEAINPFSVPWRPYARH